MFFVPLSVVWKKKKACLVNCVWRGHIEFGARNVFWSGKIYLPKRLPYQPFFRIIYGDFCRGGEAFPVALRAVEDFRKFGVHVMIKYGEKIAMEIL